MTRLSAVGSLIAVCLTGAAPALAQGRHAMEGIEIGGVGGLSSFTLAGSGVTGEHARPTFYAGLALTAPLGRELFIEPQLVYAGQGSNTKYSEGLFGVVDNSFRLTYLEVPLLIGLRFGNRPQARLYAGPAIAFNINCELTATPESEPNVTSATTCQDAGLVMKGVDLGVTGGGAVAFAFGRGTIPLEARYTLGLTTISTISSVRNQGLSLGVGYTLPVSQF